jgi:hypothetical protein
VDVTKGKDTVSFPVTGGLFTLRGYRATRGYDLVTGFDALDAARLVPELALVSHANAFHASPAETRRK